MNVLPLLREPSQLKHSEKLNWEQIRRLQNQKLRAAAFGLAFQKAHPVSNLTILENAVVAGILARVRRSPCRLHGLHT